MCCLICYLVCFSFLKDYQLCVLLVLKSVLLSLFTASLLNFFMQYVLLQQFDKHFIFNYLAIIFVEAQFGVRTLFAAQFGTKYIFLFSMYTF